MRTSSIAIVVITFVAGIRSGHSQTVELGNSPISSALSDSVRNRFAREDYSGFADMARTHSRQAVDALLEYALVRTRPDDPLATAVGAALVELGAEKYLEAIIVDASKKGEPGNFERSRAFTALSFMKTKASVRILARFLNDDTISVRTHSVFYDNSGTAFIALEEMGISGGPKTEYRVYDVRGVYIDAWRKWWTENQSRYQGDGPITDMQ